MSVGEVLAKHPAAKNILTLFHLGACSSCSVTDDHNFGEALKEYDIDREAILNVNENERHDGEIEPIEKPSKESG